MKKLNTLILIYILSFMFIINAKAECSYKERVELLNETKNVTAYIEPDVENKRFIFYLYNLNNNLYAEITNSLNDLKTTVRSTDLKDGYYSFYDYNTDDVVTYVVTFYSNKSNCSGDKLTTTRVKKPIINKYANYTMCKGIEEFYLCSTLLSNKITLTPQEIYLKIESYKEELANRNKKEKFNILNFFKSYWYYFAIAFGILIIILTIWFINKKRGELV